MHAFSRVRHGPRRQIYRRQPEERAPRVVVAQQQIRIEAAARRVEAVLGAQFITVERARRDFDARPLLPRVGVVEDDRRIAFEDDRLAQDAKAMAAMKTEALDRKSIAQFYCINILPEMEAYGVISQSGQKSLYNFTDNFFGFSQ